MLQPGGGALNYRSSGFYLQGISRVTWRIRSQYQLLVLVAPAEAALNVCPPGAQACEWRGDWGW